MAVIESKGNGYALYNGVKLPNIDAVWTEELKQTHPYAFMTIWDLYELLGDEYLLPGDVVINLYLCDEVPYIYTDDEEFWIPSENHIEVIYLSSQRVEEVYQAINPDLGLVYGEWEDIRTETRNQFFFASDGSPFWSNVEIPSHNGGENLSASDPIPLDGMNVIEWDGNTAGLVNVEILGNKIYRLADFEEASCAVLSVRVSEEYQYIDSFEQQEESWVIAVDGIPVILGSTGNNDTSYNGIYINDFIVSGDVSYIIAYTPATTEPEEPEEPETPTVEKFPLMQLIMGILSELNAGVKREPIAYLYNGVRLPKLPEWDRGVYPYAYVFTSSANGLHYFATEKTKATVYVSGADAFDGDGLYLVEGEEWAEQSDLIEIGVIVWANTDVYYGDDVEDVGGTLYLAASDPIPVYE